MRYCLYKYTTFRNREYTMNFKKIVQKHIAFRGWERKNKLNFSVCFEVQSCKKQQG